MPSTADGFAIAVLNTLAVFGRREPSSVELTRTDLDFLPEVMFAVSDDGVRPCVRFFLDNEQITVDVTNRTGTMKASPHIYEAISLADYDERRLSTLDILALDHVGFDLPYFEGVHPEVIALRSRLADACAYFRFPTGEDWDFILPAAPDEIVATDIDLTRVRKPKVEIVSLDKTSTPIIQVDFMVRQPFADLARLFPEGIHDEKLGNVWVYVTNPYNVDICFVVNGYWPRDWCGFFEGHRAG